MPAFTQFFETITDDPEVVRLLDISVGPVLVRNGWSVARASEIHDVTRHIADWIAASVRKGAAWVERLNGEGVPLKLAKCHTLDMLVHEADKAMRLDLQKREFATPAAGDEEMVAHLEDGYTLVRLDSEAALKREGAMMQHCIGLGAYDHALALPSVEFLSLRDRMGNAHVTVEVIDGRISQLKGKQNRRPQPRYVDLIVPGLRQRHLRLDAEKTVDVLVDDEDGRLFSIYSLPDGLRTKAGIFAVDLLDLTSLPASLSVAGTIFLEGSGLRELPCGLKSRDLDVGRSARLERIGSGVKIGGHLHLGGCSQLKALPGDLHVEGCLYTRWNDWFGDPPKPDEFCDSLVDLPPSIDIGGDIYLDGCRSLRQFPEGIVIRKSLNIAGTAIERLPDQLVVPENLFLGGGHLLALPKSLRVGKDLRVDLRGFGLLLAAIDARHHLEIGGSVYVDGQPVSVNLEKYPDDDPRYMEWSADKTCYFYSPPADLPVPEPRWTKCPPFKRH
jgi:hypothetical protein